MHLSKRLKVEDMTMDGDSVPNTDWRLWCRLCAMDGVVALSEQTDSTSTDIALATAIGKYFWVNIRANDDLPQTICDDCHQLVTLLGEFTERVNKVQAMFTVLQNSREPVDAKEVRVQFNLNQDWKHMMRPLASEDAESQIPQFQNVITDEDSGEERELVSDHGDPIDQSEMNFEFEDETSPKEVPTRCRKSNTLSEDELPFDEVETLEDLVQDSGDEKELEDDPMSETEHDIKTDIEDEKNVEDSDLFKELNFNVEEEEVYQEESEAGGEETALGENMMEDEVPLAVNPEGLQLLKRKRGRPPKSELKRRRAENSESEGSLDGGDSRRYECSVCNRQYKNPTSYRKHMIDLHQREPDIPELVCDKCPDKTFATERQLAVHRRTHLSLQEKMVIPCPYCDRKFTKLAVMRQHVNGIHFNEKPFICDSCGRPLKTLAALNEHKLVHTNDCPYECAVCLKGFKNRSRLKIHSDTHTETLYECTVCGTKLNTRRTLKMHMLVHSNEKQYKCNFCTSAFKRAKALKNHLILHTGMRPYKCNFCDKAFSNGSNCRSHKRKMHPKELAAEEAQGKRCEPTVVPKLDELRVGSNVVPNPREGLRPGLPSNLRSVMTKMDRRTKSGRVIEALSEDEAAALELQQYDAAGDDPAILGGNGAEEYGEDDEEEGETVIYEIIDEI